jgi:carboxyl-terminal processing protease
MRKLLLVLFTCICSSSMFAQTPTMQQKLYYTCKAWGFIKYYHSNVSTCGVNWDSVLLHVLPLVESATTSTAFNDALDTMLVAAGPVVLSTSYFPDTIHVELKRNRDWTWWVGNPLIRSDVQIQLDTIKNNFRPHVGCWVENNPHTTAYPGWLVFPYDSLALNTSMSYPNENYRLLMLYKYWNIIRYFNPYNYVLDTSWDTTLYNYVAPVANSVNSNSLYLLYMQIVTALNDAHVHGLSGNSNYEWLPGFYQPYVRLKYIGGRYVVIKSRVSGIYPGDAIISIDGLTTTQWEDSLKPYYSAGNSSVFRNIMCANMLGRQSYLTNETFVIQDSMSIINTITSVCNGPVAGDTFFYNYYYPADSLGSISWATIACDVGYVNMGNLQDSDVTKMYADLQKKSAIIFDLRNYPNGTAWDIAHLMYPSVIQYAKDIDPDVTYPGTYYWNYELEGTAGNPTPYTGKVIILMNEITLSQAEWSCMMLGAMPGAVKVGSQTDGADGNVTYWQLTTDYQFGFTTLGVFYPNGDSTQRIGIVPDSIVYPTAIGIRHNDDEVLDKALQIAGCNLYHTNVNTIQLPATLIKVIPNPANDIVIVQGMDINTQQAIITITDITGRTLLQKEVNTNSQNFTASFDIKTLSSGMYFVTVKTETQKYVSKIIKE